DAVHDLLVAAVDDGMQPAERAEAGRRAGAAEETIPLDQDGRAAAATRGDRRGNAGGAAAEHDDLVVAEQRGLPARLVDGVHGISFGRDAPAQRLVRSASPPRHRRRGAAAASSRNDRARAVDFGALTAD